MSYFLHFVPILLFVFIFVGSGIYFTLLGTQDAFYQLSPITSILPAIALAWVMNREKTEEKTRNFLDALRHRDIITMCLIFLLAGAFTEVTKNIGSVDATVNLTLSLVPSRFLIVGLFLVAALISTAIGTSMGTIATITPIAAALSREADFSASLAAATVVGGAMFGDNLSIISDTTIAAVSSQEADLKKKLKLNTRVALIASLITIAILLLSPNTASEAEAKGYSFLLVAPYIALLGFALIGINVFVSLFVSITIAGIIGLTTKTGYDILTFSQSINRGFININDIMLLSLLVGGLSGLLGKNFAKDTAQAISAWIVKRNAGPRLAQLIIAKLVSIFDILLANNTIAIIFSGEVAREIARQHKIPPHYSATWLDIFSCVFQGIIPYGAQVLLASSIAGTSPLEIVPQVYYCYLLGIVATLYILLKKVDRLV